MNARVVKIMTANIYMYNLYYFNLKNSSIRNTLGKNINTWKIEIDTLINNKQACNTVYTTREKISYRYPASFFEFPESISIFSASLIVSLFACFFEKDWFHFTVCFDGCRCPSLGATNCQAILTLISAYMDCLGF